MRRALVHARRARGRGVCMAEAVIYDAGLPHPPPHRMVPPLACQVGSCLVWPCCFPRLVLFGLVPSLPVEWGLWSFWLAPPRLWGPVCSTEVRYGCCRLLVHSNVIVPCLVPSPPPVRRGLWSFFDTHTRTSLARSAENIGPTIVNMQPKE